MGQQKIGDALVGINLIFDAGKAVPLIFINLDVYRSPTFFDGIDDLLRF